MMFFYLVMIFTVGVDSGADMVGLLNMSVNGRSGQVAGRDGG